jgi:hypothetical protein
MKNLPEIAVRTIATVAAVVIAAAAAAVAVAVAVAAALDDDGGCGSVMIVRMNTPDIIVWFRAIAIPNAFEISILNS